MTDEAIACPMARGECVICIRLLYTKHIIVAWLKVFGHLQPNSLGCSHYTMVSDWCVACDEDAHYAYTGQYHDITRTELPNNSYADSLKLRRWL